MPPPHQNWSGRGAGGLYGGYTSQGGTGFVVGRSELDSRRIGEGRIPQAEYPDGYLGTIRSRNDDKMLDSIKNRENQRAYQRGVHKGERIDQADYMWPRGLDPQRGLRNQLRGVKTAPMMGLAPSPHLVNDGKANVRADIPQEFNPIRAASLQTLRPPWS